MTSSHTGAGPDLVIAGAARSATTQLASRLSLHSSIDPCAVKEPNFFSSEYERGTSWYDSYFSPRSASLVRMDASVSYTYPQHPDALRRLAKAAPKALVVYVVRDPVARAVSHYGLNKYYFGHEHSRDFGAALSSRPFYLEVSDYERWLGELHSTFPTDRLLVVPFQAVAEVGGDVANVVLARLGLEEPPEVDEAQVRAHQNNVVTFRNQTLRRVTRTLRHSAAYPAVRRVLGPYAVKRVRALVTRVPDMPTTDQALGSCDQRQRDEMDALRDRVEKAVADELEQQDARLGLSWARHWVPSPAAQ